VHWHEGSASPAFALFLSGSSRFAPRQALNPRERKIMNEQEFQAKLGELISQINNVPESDRTDLLKLAEETKTRHDRLKRTIGELQDSLDYLRLSVKYLVFDLEATRRENQYLRKLLDRQAGTSDQNDQNHND
jgi:hypothetical protein